MASFRLKSWGLSLVVHWSFEGLAEARAGVALMPNFDGRSYRGGEGFWLEMRDDAGPAATQAARLYRTFEASLADLLTSLSFFYAPVDVAAGNEVCACAAPSASRLRGRILYSGGTWARKDLRGRMYAAILPRVSRTLALFLWSQNYTISLVEEVIVRKGVAEAYGYRNVEPGIRWLNSASFGAQDLSLLWMDQPELEQDLVRALVLGEVIPAGPQNKAVSPAHRPGSGSGREAGHS